MGNVEGAAQAIADALAPTQQSPSARWRWGTVASVQDDGTITAAVGGATVSGIRAAQQAMGAAAGDRVRICYIGTEAFADSLRASSKLIKLPSIEAGSLALGTPLTVDNGGTGADNASDARANLLAVGYQSGMNAAVANFVGSNQMWGLRAKVINANNTDYVDHSVYIMLRNNGISAYDATASSYPWQLALPSGTTDLTVNVHAPTITNATATKFETRRQGNVVNLSVYQLKLSAALANGSSVSLGTGIIGANARPTNVVYLTLVANVAGFGSGVLMSIGTGGNVTVYNRSGASLGTGVNLMGNTSWVI